MLQDHEESLASNQRLQANLDSTKAQLAQFQQQAEAAQQLQKDSFLAEQQASSNQHTAQVQALQQELLALTQQISTQQLQAEADALQAADSAGASDSAVTEMQNQLASAQERCVKAENDASKAQQNANDLQQALQKAESLTADLKTQMANAQSRSQELTPPATPPARMTHPGSHQVPASHAAPGRASASATANANINIGAQTNGPSQGSQPLPGWPGAHRSIPQSRFHQMSSQQGHEGSPHQPLHQLTPPEPHGASSARRKLSEDTFSSSPPQTLSLDEAPPSVQPGPGEGLFSKSGEHPAGDDAAANEQQTSGLLDSPDLQAGEPSPLDTSIPEKAEMAYGDSAASASGWMPGEDIRYPGEAVEDTGSAGHRDDEQIDAAAAASSNVNLSWSAETPEFDGGRQIVQQEDCSGGICTAISSCT